MAGRWSDDNDWRVQRSAGRDQQGYRDRDRGDSERWAGGEQRSFGPRDRVFGEEEYGAAYNREPAGKGQVDWQDRDYGGVSPAMRRQEYERAYGAGAYEGPGSSRRGGRAGSEGSARDYTGGGRYLGDDARRPIYREEYGMGGREYGNVPRGYDEGERFGTREADERWAREMRRPVSGGTGGYDYERGYGDAGRGRRRDRDDDHEGFEDRAREAGDFFRRTGQKISHWFSDAMDDDDDRRDYGGERGHRGRGPKGYQRPDERISDEVHHRLTDDSWLDASNINVSVSGGEVTLSGTVEDRESKHRAERLVEDLGGVKHVQNNLRVDEGSFFTRPTRGFGDSAQEARMRNAETESPATAGGAQAERGPQQQGGSKPAGQG